MRDEAIKQARCCAHECWWKNSAPENVYKGMENAVGINGIELRKLDLCDSAIMYSVSSVSMRMRCAPMVDDEGAPGRKSPSSNLALDPVRGQDQDPPLRHA